MPWLVEDSGLYPGHAVLDERGLARIFVLKAAADYHSLTLPSVTREQKGGNSCQAFLVLIDRRFLVLSRALAGPFDACLGSQAVLEAETLHDISTRGVSDIPS